jgi:hypothetical protein
MLLTPLSPHSVSAELGSASNKAAPLDKDTTTVALAGILELAPHPRPSAFVLTELAAP